MKEIKISLTEEGLINVDTGGLSTIEFLGIVEVATAAVIRNELNSPKPEPKKTKKRGSSK